MGEYVHTFAISPVLQCAGLPDLVLLPGMGITGVVTERVGAHGLLLLAGIPVVAELPPEVQAGHRLRLRVTDTAGEKATLAILSDATAQATEREGVAPLPATPTATPQSPPIAFALPGGLAARLQVHEDDGSDEGRPGGSTAVTLQLDSPELGRLTLRLDAASCAVHCSAGAPAAVVRGAVPELEQALSLAVGRPMLVTVHPRTEALDLRA